MVSTTQEFFTPQKLLEMERSLYGLVETLGIPEEERASFYQMASGLPSFLKEISPTSEELKMTEVYREVAERYLASIADRVAPDGSPFLNIGQYTPVIIGVGYPDYVRMRQEGVIEFPISITRVLGYEDTNGVKKQRVQDFLTYETLLQVKGNEGISPPTKEQIYKSSLETIASMTLTTIPTPSL